MCCPGSIQEHNNGAHPVHKAASLVRVWRNPQRYGGWRVQRECQAESEPHSAHTTDAVLDLCMGGTQHEPRTLHQNADRALLQRLNRGSISKLQQCCPAHALYMVRQYSKHAMYVAACPQHTCTSCWPSPGSSQSQRNRVPAAVHTRVTSASTGDIKY